MSTTTQQPGSRPATRPARADTRDPAWLEALFRAHQRDVLAYAVRRVGPQAADDVLAEVFTTAWRHRDKVPDPPLPWLYRTAANHVLHARRSAARQVRLTTRLTGLADPREPAGDPTRAIEETVEDAIEVRAVLAALPERDAELLMLQAWEGLSVAEIGYVAGCSAATVRVRLHRARRRAKELLAARDADRSAARTLPTLATEESS